MEGKPVRPLSEAQKKTRDKENRDYMKIDRA